MRRRELILGASGALTWPLRVRAQQNPMSVVGLLDATKPTPVSLDGIRKGLTETGFYDGQNVVIRYRAAEGHYDRLPDLFADLLRERVDVIIAPQLPSVLAAKAASTAIPIVFMMGDDPVKQGLVASLSRPGGNATGLSMLTAGLDAKRLQVLRDLAPNVTRFGLIINPHNANAETQVNETRTAAHVLARDIEILQARSDQDIEATFTASAERRIGALVVGADPFLSSRKQQIVGLAERYRLPAIYEWRESVDIGGLASYGSSQADNYRHLGIYVGKILKGAKPADLPVMQPTKFELVINLKTAKALGLTVSPILLAQANEVIE